MARQVNGLFPGVLQPDVSIAGGIDIFENAWPNPKETIRAVEQACADVNSGVNWERAETFGGGAYQDIRTNMHLQITRCAELFDNPLMQQIHNQFYLMLAASSIPYTERYSICEGIWHEPYTMLKYASGQEYKGHYDGHTGAGRHISAICYLNNEFEGGEIEFPHHNVRIKPEPGMLILFPSNFSFLHVAKPVSSGTKYALVTWLHDRPIG
jgi:predicted 2-oxoglutarate/Fe(II)-dependent dioxygenase YbiX